MQGAVYHGPRDVRVESVPEPGVPGTHEVRLGVLRAALCGTDVAEYTDGPTMIPLTRRHPASGHFGPMIIGHEFVGQVEQIGSAVEGIAVGDRVVPGAGMWCGSCAWCRAGRTNLCADYYTLGLNADGGLTERINVPDRMCCAVPTDCGDDAAAMAQPLAVALHAVRRARVAAGEVVVLIGVGGIGLFVLAGLVASGARVIAVDVDPARLASALQFGAITTVDARSDEFEERLSAAAGGAPVDVVAEASGAPSAVGLAQRLVRRGGRMLLIGLQKGLRELDLADLVVREVEILTSVAHVCGRDLPEALELLASTDVASRAVDRVIPLDQIVAGGLEPLAAGQVAGKVLVTPGQ